MYLVLPHILYFIKMKKPNHTKSILTGIVNGKMFRFWGENKGQYLYNLQLEKDVLNKTPKSLMVKRKNKNSSPHA